MALKTQTIILDSMEFYDSICAELALNTESAKSIKFPQNYMTQPQILPLPVSFVHLSTQLLIMHFGSFFVKWDSSTLYIYHPDQQYFCKFAHIFTIYWADWLPMGTGSQFKHAEFMQNWRWLRAERAKCTVQNFQKKFSYRILQG